MMRHLQMVAVLTHVRSKKRWHLRLLGTVSVVLATLSMAQAQSPAEISAHPAQKIGRTAGESGPPEWPQNPAPAPGAPNILVIMTDDVGFGASSTFGGPVPTATFDALARDGLRYNRFNTTALCSPTRAALLTGRNPQNVGMGNVTNIPTGYDGYTSVIPKSAGTMAQLLKQAGYNTAMLGKGHLTPEWEVSQAGPFDRWPTGLGFEYFYGFLSADTSMWAPNLVENTRPVEPRYNDPGYHFEQDMADRAIAWLQDQHAAAPSKPFFMYYATGTAHTPHHAPKDWLDRFRGKFDQGWDRARAETFARQKKLGVVPKDAKLTPRPASLPAWDSLSPDQKRVYARLMEAFAASLSFADAQIGRVIQSLEESGQLDNTLVIYIQGDNGGSAEGGLHGLMFEQTAITGGKETFADLLAHIRIETTQDVPVSVTALGPEQLARYDLTNLERVAATTPQFTIGRAPSGSGATLVMRGIGSNSTSIGLEQSVAVVVDGAYYGQGRVINEGFFDLSRLEIFKGPQALFFGKNATAGVVSITTADPTDTPEFSARVGYEFHSQQVTGEAIGSGPLSDTLGVRIAVRRADTFGSYFTNNASDVIYPTTDLATGIVTQHLSPRASSHPGKGQETYGRITFKWEPTERLTATIKANAGENNINNPAANSVLYHCPIDASALNPAVPCGKNFATSAADVPADIAATVPYAGKGGLTNRYRSWAVNANLNYDLDNVTLTSVTNYNYNRNIFVFDADSVAAPGAVGVYATEWSNWRAFSSEFRALTTLESALNVMLGGYYQSTKREYLAFTASGGLENSNAPEPFQRYLANSKDSQTKGETFAAFGQVIWEIVPDLEATGGVRYTHETKDSYFLQPYSHPTRVAQGIFEPGTTITANQTFDNWSPEATLSYKPTADITVYGAYKTAYKSGGFSNSGILSPAATVHDFAFNPEKASGFEVGVKTTLFDRQLRFNVGLYSYQIKNLQIDFFNSPVFAFSTINAGSARSKGVETEFEFAPRAVAGLNLRGSLNYNKARYGNVPDAPCYTGQTPAAGCVIPGPGQRPIQNLKGQPTANAPLWTATLGVSYETPVSDDWIVAVSTDARYSDDYLASAFGNPNTRQGSYVNLDASARLRSADDQWEVALIGKNLTNRFYATGGIDAPSTGSGTGTAGGKLGDQVGYIALPRSVQMQLAWRY